jgi:SAM-dependent methyltransferase
MGWLRFDAIRRALAIASPKTVLELGAGEGAMGWRLAQRSDYVGVEPDPTSYSVLRERLEQLGVGESRRGSGDALGADETFDLICAFEVLEHIEDDAGALRAWSSHLRDAGWLLISVPAHSDRFGPTDEAVGHFRRYDRDTLVGALQDGGFELVQLTSYGMVVGHVADRVRNAVVRRRSFDESREGRTAASGRLMQPKSSATGALRWAAALPFRAVQRPLASTDWGVGFVALARRSNGA